MFGSYLLGFVGWIVQLVGALLALAGLVMVGRHEDGSWLAFVIMVALIIGGGFLKYLSKHSVRVRP
jgi:hypothetical protein